MFMKLFKNQLGFSLIQGMVLATAVAGMAYIGTMMTTDLKMAQKTAESQLRVDQLHKTIYALLQDKNNCERTFFQNGIQPLPYTCYSSIPNAHVACNSLGGSPGAHHRNGEGPCFLPGGPGPDTVCLTLTDSALGGSCNAYLLCHGVGAGTANSLVGTKIFTNGIWSKTSPSSLFKVNTNIGTANYDASMMYMNNSVTIVSMNLKFPVDLATQNAELKILYGKLDKNELSSRSGKGYGTNRIAKDVQIKIQRDPTTKGFLSCYAVTTNTNDKLHQEFCESLTTSGATGEKIFTWDVATNTCKLNFSCGTSQIFTGWDSNGIKKCRNISDWMNLADLLGPSAACDLRTTKPVKFVKIGNKIQVNCGTSTSTTCSTACNCPNSLDACIGGVCVTQSWTSCSPGAYVKGDSSCQWRCDAAGTSLSCPVGGMPCGGSTSTPCSSACDCPGSYDVCISGLCVNKQTGCTTGQVAKGDSSCKWSCNSGMWTCPVGGTACGASLPASCYAAGYLCECGTTPPTFSCAVIDRVSTSSGTKYCSNTASSQCCDPMTGTCQVVSCLCY